VIPSRSFLIISEAKQKIDDLMAENLKLADKVARQEVKDHIEAKCADEALTDEETEMIKKLLEGITDTTEVDEKFEAVVKYVKEQKVVMEPNAEKVSKDEKDGEEVKKNKKMKNEENVDGNGTAIVEGQEDHSDNLSDDMKAFRRLTFGAK
jgi:phage shock protein A